MKISELIKQLEWFKSDQGDLNVYKSCDAGSSVELIIGLEVCENDKDYFCYHDLPEKWLRVTA